MEVEDVEDVNELDGEESPAAESRLARNVANLAMAAAAYYTPKAKRGRRALVAQASACSCLLGAGSIQSQLTRQAKACATWACYDGRSTNEAVSLGKTYPTIEDSVRNFIEAQPVFFVGSAPLDAAGHVNVSPKGLNTLRILGPATLAYLDLTGSGIETVSHLKENGRIVLMFCALEGPPRILRIHGCGRVVEPGQAEFAELAPQFPEHEGTRSVIVVEVTRVADSCGFGVPLLEFKGQRTQLPAWAHRKGPDGLAAYRREKNRTSIDGKRGLETPP